MVFKSDQNEYVGKLEIIYWWPKEMFYLNDCAEHYSWFEATTPSVEDKIWKITLKKTLGVRQIVIHCNNVEVLDLTISYSTCKHDPVSWSRDVGKIRFTPWDTASDFYALFRSGDILLSRSGNKTVGGD